MKKEKLLHSTKIQQMIAQYKHDMQLVDQLTTDAEPHYEIEQELYKKYEVKRGLRDLDGKGVRAGLTTISKVSATQIVDGREVPALASRRSSICCSWDICRKPTSWHSSRGC